jgi:hypothetical protein
MNFFGLENESGESKDRYNWKIRLTPPINYRLAISSKMGQNFSLANRFCTPFFHIPLAELKLQDCNETPVFWRSGHVANKL